MSDTPITPLHWEAMRERVVERAPLYDHEAESSALGAALLDGECAPFLCDLLRPDDFYFGSHRSILSVIAALVAAGGRVDPVTVNDGLREAGEAAGGMPYLITLRDSCPSATNLEQYAAIVRRFSLLRQASQAAERIQGEAVNGGDLSKIATLATKLAGEALSEGGRDKLVSVGEAVKEFYVSLGEQDGPSSPTGFPDVDRILGGIFPSDLLVVAARPSRGKSALALNVARNFARRGEVVLFCSLEMSRQQVAMRMLALESGISLTSLIRNSLAKEDFAHLARAVEAIGTMPIEICDTPAITPLSVHSKVLTAKAENGGRLDLIVVDYLQLMRPSQRQESRVQEVSAITGELKGLARESGCPVLAVSQLSRQIEQRGRAAHPKLSDLRDSGSVEQDADVVIFIHSSIEDEDEQAASKRAQPYQVEIIVAKHRNGPTGQCSLTFRPYLTAFESMSRREG